jgi:chromosome segregation ATPase
LITWQKYEEFKAQDSKHHEIREKYTKKARDAGQRVEDLKAELGAILTREFREGKNLTAEKEKKRKEMEQAEKEYGEALEEKQKALEFTRTEAESDRITIRDLILDWNRHFVTEVREKELSKIVDRMAKAREEYYNAITDFKELKDKYHPLHSHFKEKVREYYKAGADPGNHLMVNSVAETSDLPMITDDELYSIQTYNRWPSGVERKPLKKEGK